MTSSKTPAHRARQRGHRARGLDLTGILKEDASFLPPPWSGRGASGAALHHPALSNPAGFEVDIAEEIGTRLGLETKWIEFVWTNLFSPAPKPFDFDINETTITDERDQVVDFSIPYFEANQAVLVHKGTDAENATTPGRREGPAARRARGYDGLGYIRDTISSSQKERVFATTPPPTRRS